MDFSSNIACNLSEDQFENLANRLVERINGNEIISFAKGSDSGKDGRRIGFAKDIEKWKNAGSKLVVQAKHTSNPIASCSESKFHGNKSSIIEEEIKRVIDLHGKGELEYYILVTNRKYTGGIDSKIRKTISQKTGIDIDNIEIFGTETINQLLSSSSNRDIVVQFGLNSSLGQLEFSNDEIKEVILTFKSQLTSISLAIENDDNKLKYDYSHIDKTKKNEKNNLSLDYYESEILNRSLIEFDKIEQFLEDPINAELKEYYYDIAHEINQIITSKRDSFANFEELFFNIYGLICDQSFAFSGGKRHVTTFLHYMYMNCLIGKK